MLAIKETISRITFVVEQLVGWELPGALEAKVLMSAAVMADKEYKLKTAPFDARFPNMNQTRNCWQNYVDFHRCHKIKGEDHAPCDYFKRVYKSLCPNSWSDKWDEQMGNGTFPGKI